MSHPVQLPAIPAEHAELLRRLRELKFDKPDAIDTFERKLKKQQRWSMRYTLRAIDEYWKFHVLRQMTGCEVSPSYAVDMVWHLHLQYTRSYWHKLCRDILGQEVHHMPSDGTSTDKTRCRDFYQETLDHYRRFFGEPPADIWPAPGTSRWVMLGYGYRDAFFRLSESVVRLWNHIGDTAGEAMRHAPYPYH
jgi:hypothetical protein